MDGIFIYELLRSFRIFIILIYFIPSEEGTIIEPILRTPIYILGNKKEIIGLFRIMAE